MPVIRPSDARTHALHGSEFHAYVAPSRGSGTLAAWQLEVAPDSVGVAHCPDQEEVLLVQRGSLTVELDQVSSTAVAGDVVLVPAGARFRVGAGAAGATAWVTTTAGLSATTDDGSTITPPWAR